MDNEQPVYTYKGVTVRKGSRNTAYIRLDEQTFIALIDESERTGLPMAELIRVSSQPCSYCKNIHVVTMNSSDQFVQVKRGLICPSFKKQTSGVTIINKKRKNESTQQ